MLPTATFSVTDDFAFDPIKEQAMKAAEEARLREREMHMINKLKNQERLKASGKVTQADLDAGIADSDDETDSKIARDRQAAEDEANQKVTIHTKLTTFHGIELYRTVVQDYITVFVKVLPGSLHSQDTGDTGRYCLHFVELLLLPF